MAKSRTVKKISPHRESARVAKTLAHHTVASTPYRETTRIARTLAYHENAAATLRAAIALLGQEPGRPGPRSNGLAPTLRAAVELDRARRNGHGDPEELRKRPGPKPKRRQPGGRVDEMLKRRAQSAARLELFDSKVPKTAAAVGIKGSGQLGILVKTGYLKASGDGYLRTSKVFRVDPRPV